MHHITCSRADGYPSFKENGVLMDMPQSWDVEGEDFGVAARAFDRRREPVGGVEVECPVGGRALKGEGVAERWPDGEGEDGADGGEFGRTGR